jgi:predicted RNA-binding protein YlqC (UPF0109 family)
MSDQDKVEDLRNILEVMVVGLVDDADGVQVEAVSANDGKFTVLSVSTAPGEVGRVIGRAGKNAIAIRAIIDAVAAKHRIRFMLDIADDRGRGDRNE